MPPVVTCPSNIVNTIAAGLPGVPIHFASATVTDNSGSFVLLSVNPPSGSTFPVGTTPVTYTYRDSSDNRASCTFFITISIGEFTEEKLYYLGGIFSSYHWFNGHVFARLASLTLHDFGIQLVVYVYTNFFKITFHFFVE